MEAKRVWIIDEGSQGHVVQSRGLVRELRHSVPLEVTEFRCRFSVKHRWLRSLAKKSLRWFPSMALLKTTHELSGIPEGKPDLILSSGPNSLLALAYFSKLHGCPSVFVQGTIRVPENTVTCIMRPDEGETRADYIFIPLLFNEITPELLEATRVQLGLPSRSEDATPPCKALFVGESSGKIQFSRNDWEMLAEFVNRSWRADGIQWLISTSYRTSEAVEELLRQTIEPAAIRDVVWYSKAPRKITRVFLSTASSVYVTMDSLTMMTEAVSSGLPVWVIRPADFSFDPGNTHHRYISGLHEAGLIALFEPGNGEPEQAAGQSRAALDYSDAVTRLLGRIGWRP